MLKTIHNYSAGEHSRENHSGLADGSNDPHGASTTWLNDVNYFPWKLITIADFSQLFQKHRTLCPWLSKATTSLSKVASESVVEGMPVIRSGSTWCKPACCTEGTRLSLPRSYGRAEIARSGSLGLSEDLIQVPPGHKMSNGINLSVCRRMGCGRRLKSACSVHSQTPI